MNPYYNQNYNQYGGWSPNPEIVINTGQPMAGPMGGPMGGLMGVPMYGLMGQPVCGPMSQPGYRLGYGQGYGQPGMQCQTTIVIDNPGMGYNNPQVFHNIQMQRDMDGYIIDANLYYLNNGYYHHHDHHEHHGHDHHRWKYFKTRNGEKYKHPR